MPLQVLRLNLGRIAQNKRCHLYGRGSSQNGSAVQCREERQTACMVEVTVCQQHSIELCGRVGKRCAILFFSVLTALKEPAIHQQSCLVGFNQVCRSGHFAACGAERCNFHKNSFAPLNSPWSSPETGP